MDSAARADEAFPRFLCHLPIPRLSGCFERRCLGFLQSVLSNASEILEKCPISDTNCSEVEILTRPFVETTMEYACQIKRPKRGSLIAIQDGALYRGVKHESLLLASAILYSFSKEKRIRVRQTSSGFLIEYFPKKNLLIPTLTKTIETTDGISCTFRLLIFETSMTRMPQHDTAALINVPTSIAFSTVDFLRTLTDLRAILLAGTARLCEVKRTAGLPMEPVLIARSFKARTYMNQKMKPVFSVEINVAFPCICNLSNSKACPGHTGTVITLECCGGLTHSPITESSHCILCNSSISRRECTGQMRTSIRCDHVKKFRKSVYYLKNSKRMKTVLQSIQRLDVIKGPVTTSLPTLPCVHWLTDFILSGTIFVKNGMVRKGMPGNRTKALSPELYETLQPFRYLFPSHVG